MSRQAATARIPSNAGHRTGVRRTPAPRAPRRVSGPASHRNAATAAATAVAPRTVAARQGAVAAPLPRLLPDLGRVRALPDHGFLDALLRSRAWIWLIGVLLGGVVAMQVSLLKLNSGIGRAVQASSTLERQNADLEAQIARLSSGERIRTAAQAAGMILPDAGSIRYLDTREGDARRAARRMEPPSSAALALVAAGGIGTPVAGATTTTTTAPATATQPVQQQQQQPAPTQQQASVPPQPTPTPQPAATPAPTPPAAAATGTTGATAAPSGQG